VTKSEKRAIIHIGRHKTGTTAIQEFLESHSDLLKQKGILYPASGRLGAGHHNLAWELDGDGRFDPSRGTLRDLEEEIKDFDKVVLSSEDFSVMRGHESELGLLANVLAGQNFKVTVIIVLRERNEWLRSIGLELLKHNLDNSIEGFQDQEILTRNWNGRAVEMSMNDDDIIREFSSVFGKSHMQTVAYDRTDMVKTFLESVAPFFPNVILNSETGLRKNTSFDTLGTLQNEIVSGRKSQVLLEQKTVELAAKQGEVSLLENEKTSLGQQITDLKQQVADLNQQILDFRNSTSWKVTKPLRAVRRKHSA
jgi:hypothetical protein